MCEKFAAVGWTHYSHSTIKLAENSNAYKIHVYVYYTAVHHLSVKSPCITTNFTRGIVRLKVTCSAHTTVELKDTHFAHTTVKLKDTHFVHITVKLK